ncbi:hypothetical protein EMCRGX_G030959 [Ephydatia muelleri]
MWHTKSDYLFFRNNVPDYQRLRTNLVRKKGTRAYACQCSWHSVEDTTEVASLTTLNVSDVAHKMSSLSSMSLGREKKIFGDALLWDLFDMRC